MEKYLSKRVTPATTRKSNNARTDDEFDSPPDEPRTLNYEDYRERAITDEENDMNYDLDDAQIAALTQMYTQVAEEEESTDEFQEEGVTTLTQDFLERSPKRQKVTFPKDTEEQVYLDVNGVRKIYKIGESFTSDEWTASLLRANRSVPPCHRGAIFTILFFHPKGARKAAECAVRIPLSDAFIWKDEHRLRITQHNQSEEFVRLPKSERVELSKLNRRKLDAKPLSEEALVWSLVGGDTFRIAFEYCPGKMSMTFFDEMGVGPKPTVLDLFAGAGGMSTGLQWANFDVRWMVEQDPTAAATLKLNHRQGNAQVFEEDVRLFLEKSRRGEPGYPRPGEVTHTHASPPCQGYSDANRNGGRNDFLNNAMTFLWIDAIQYFQPETASFENVTGRLKSEGLLGDEPVHYWEKLLSTLLLETGYHFRAGILKASEYGDPQDRNRLFIVAAKRGRLLPEFPEPTHGKKGNKPLVTVGDRLEDLASIEPRAGNGLVRLQDGTYTLDHSIAGMPSLRAEREKLDFHKPGKTVRRTNCIEHYRHERSITVREMARLQSFPDTYEFCGTAQQKRNQIGNAVPCCLAKAVAKSIYEKYI